MGRSVLMNFGIGGSLVRQITINLLISKINKIFKFTKGKGNKLEKLVFYKLKALNLLKKAHSEFVHLGASLESKYDTSMDNHYIAVNLGESACGLSLKYAYTLIIFNLLR